MSRPHLRFLASNSGWLVARFVKALSSTWRADVTGLEHLQAVRDEKCGIIFCFWHGRMLELAALHAGKEVGVLVSSHPDGVMAAKIVGPLGYVPIRGSRRRTPVAGFRAMMRHAAAGGDLAITPDAHTDIHSVLPGAVALARRTGHALVPVAAAARPCRRVESWDRFEIPWPGARVKIRYGSAVWVAKAADERLIANASQELGIRLCMLHRQLESEFTEQPRRVERRRRATLSG